MQIVAGTMCVVMVAILITLFFMNHKRNSERADQLKQRAQDLKQEESDKLDAASDIYDDLAQDPGLRSIVCWGDNEMAGSESLNLPKALREVIEENLFTEANTEFSGVIDLEGKTTPSATVSNMGVSNEGMREILVRAGVNELQLGEWTVLPADKEPKNLVFRDDVSSSSLRFAEQREARFGQVIIEDIPGTLEVGEGEYDEDHPRFAFVRDEEGDSISAGSGTEVLIASATKFVDDIPVFFFEDDSADSVDSFVEDIEDLVWRYTDSEDEDTDEEYTESSSEAFTGSTAEAAAVEEPSDRRKYVVICTAYEDSDLDYALREAFGSHYIRNDSYAYEMSEDKYRELAQKVFDKLDSLGCFDTAKEKAAKAVEDLDNLSVKKER